MTLTSTTTITTTTHALSSSTSKPSPSVSSIFPAAQHFLSKEHFQYDFSSQHPPALVVEPGDLVHVETNDCFHGKIRPETTQAGTYVNGSILDSLPTKFRNPVTGPIFVKGAEPGDVLAISLLDIRPKGVGVACCGSWGGQLSCWMTKNSATLKFFDLSKNGSMVKMREEENGDDPNMYCQPIRSGSMPPRIKQKRLGPISFEASPMLGVIGVAPETANDPIGTMPAGKHGGNLDDPCNGIGATIYIPIHHEGGLFSIGDMHASQGDGEIAGSGIEIGGDVLLKCAILKHEELYNSDDDDKQENQNSATEESQTDELDASLLQLEYPLTETSTHWITHGVTICDIPQTTSIACQEAAKILISQWGFTKEEAFCFLSVRGNLGLCQACHPDKGTQIAKMAVPKLENLCPRPFRAQLLESESSMDDGLG